MIIIRRMTYGMSSNKTGQISPAWIYSHTIQSTLIRYEPCESYRIIYTVYLKKYRIVYTVHLVHRKRLRFNEFTE